MNKKFMVKASLFTLILALITIGTIVVAAVMQGNIIAKPAEESSLTTPTAWVPTSSSVDPTKAESYIPFNGDPGEFCEGEEEVCALMAEDRGDGYPNLTSSLLQQINKEIPPTDVHFKD